MVRKKRPNTIVITGGAGFIGSHLCEYFINQGDKVICIDNFLTGSRRNIKQFKAEKRFDLMKHDVSKHIKVTGKVDAVFHFASPASPVDYLKFPIKTLKVGSLGTHNTLGLAKLKKAKYVIASTSEVYGDPQVHPQPESYWGHVNPIGPRGVYDEAKRFAEAMTLAYKRAHKVDVKIGRIFNTYGPRMRAHDGRVIPNFIDQAIRGQDITIYGRGKQTRSFGYIDDLVAGYIKLYKSKYSGPFNIGNPGEFNMLQLAKLVIKHTKSTSKLVYEPLPIDDPQRRCPDLTQTRKYLKWEPKVSLEDGLQSTIAYFQSIKS
ncbi:MAG: dTDP-glucose 4,6-dehydratase [Candidatus Omnitrophota bacterium]|jgi:dTDP-glucose 4,6-dehydratase